MLSLSRGLFVCGYPNQSNNGNTLEAFLTRDTPLRLNCARAVLPLVPSGSVFSTGSYVLSANDTLTSSQLSDCLNVLIVEYPGTAM